jgi:hypothetical protein
MAYTSFSPKKCEESTKEVIISVLHPDAEAPLPNGKLEAHGISRKVTCTRAWATRSESSLVFLCGQRGRQIPAQSQKSGLFAEVGALHRMEASIGGASQGDGGKEADAIRKRA